MSELKVKEDDFVFGHGKVEIGRGKIYDTVGYLTLTRIEESKKIGSYSEEYPNHKVTPYSDAHTVLFFENVESIDVLLEELVKVKQSMAHKEQNNG